MGKMDKYKLLEEDERSTRSKTKLGLKILGFCFCAMFLGSVLLNVYYLRNMTKDKSVVHTGHISKHGPELTMTKNSKRNNMGMNLKNTVRKSSHVDLKKIVNQDDALRAAVAKIQIQQDDCTEDCGYEILGTALICGAYYSDEDDWIDCMITYTSYDCFDCLCELLEAEEGYSCSVNDKKKMNQKAKLVKPTKNVGACEGGADCGDGWCCYDTDYPVCCPDTDFYTNWCAVDADSCPQSSKTLPKMAAKKKLLKSMKMIGDEQCDGTDCGNGWCCNDDDYSICCPICDDGTQWCAGCPDDCPDCVINNIRDMAANK